MTSLGSTIIEFDIAQRSHKILTLDEFEFSSSTEKKIYWIHCNLNDQDFFKKISQKISLQENVVALCEEQDPMPKLIDTDEEITIQTQCLLSTAKSLHDETNEFGNLIIHLSTHYCLTATYQDIPALHEFNNTYTKSLKFAKTPCFILFLVLDNAINDYAKMLFNFELMADQMDLEVRSDHKNIYSEVMDVKNHMMKNRRNIAALREILMRVSGRKISVISDQCRSSLNNLLNQSQMIFNEADSIRDILNDLLDQIDNALMQKMSETMRVLTAFAAIFLPLTLITGIYGMNFHWMPELEWKYGYFIALGVLIGCATILLIIFKKKKWF